MLAKKFKLPVDTFPRQAAVILDDSNLTLRGITNNLTHDRVGIVFKKGAFKTASLRNRIKRIVFDFFRANWPKSDEDGLDPVRGRGSLRALAASNGMDLLVTVKPAIITLNTKQIKEYLKKHVIIQRNIASPPRKRPGSNI